MTAVIADRIGLLHASLLYLALIAFHVLAPDRSADPEDNDWLVEGDLGFGSVR